MAPRPYPPGPPGRWLTGSLREFGRNRLGFFTSLARDYGDVAVFRLGRRRVFLLSHPSAIEEVLVTGSRNYTKHFAIRLNRLLLGNGLLSSEGDFWLRQRRLAQPAFLRDRIASYAGCMVEAALRMTDRWQDGEKRDLHADMMQLALEIAARTMFGAEVTDRARDVKTALEAALAAYVARLRSLFLLPEWVPTPNHLRLRRAVRRLDEIVFGMIQERRRRGGEGDDLLSLLLHARDEDDGRTMTDRQLRDECMTLFLAGHETTALALTWAWYVLAGHPEIEARLVAELGAQLGGRPPTPADLPRLPYTERVVLETLRLYPPVYAVGREAITDCEVGGYRVPAGTTLLMSQWVVHRDGRFFADPEMFNPDRWSEDLGRAIPRFAYFPFGGGPRVCIGNSFALMEAALILATVVPRFRLTLVARQEIVPRAFLTLRPEHGMQMVVTRR
jgi:cytochrome P450